MKSSKKAVPFLLLLTVLPFSCSHLASSAVSSAVSSAETSVSSAEVSSSRKKLSKTEMWTKACAAVLAYQDTLTSLTWEYSSNTYYSFDSATGYWSSFDEKTEESFSSDDVYEATTTYHSYAKTATSDEKGELTSTTVSESQTYEEDGILRSFIDSEDPDSIPSYCEWKTDSIHNIAYVQKCLRDSAVGIGKAIQEKDSYPNSYSVVTLRGASVRDYSLNAFEHADGSFTVEMYFGILPLESDLDDGPMTEDYMIGIDADGKVQKATMTQRLLTDYDDASTLTSVSSQSFTFSDAPAVPFTGTKKTYSAEKYPSPYAMIPEAKDMTGLAEGTLTAAEAYPYLLCLDGYSQDVTKSTRKVTLPQDATKSATEQLSYSYESTMQEYEGEIYEETGKIQANVAQDKMGTGNYQANLYTENYVRTLRLNGFRIEEDTTSSDTNLYLGLSSTRIQTYRYPDEVISLEFETLHYYSQISPTSIADPYSTYSLKQVGASAITSAAMKDGILTITFNAYCGTEGKSNVLTVEIGNNHLLKTSFVKEDDLFTFDDSFHTTTTVYDFFYDAPLKK